MCAYPHKGTKCKIILSAVADDALVDDEIIVATENHIISDDVCGSMSQDSPTEPTVSEVPVGAISELDPEMRLALGDLE